MTGETFLPFILSIRIVHAKMFAEPYFPCKSSLYICFALCYHPYTHIHTVLDEDLENKIW